ncbi:methyltransferase domain-containing protein [Pseudomonas sp. TNT2022 ID642]|uniref:methyltransferase domain-containing protein n=1 Tax=Pseudomonas sp. TNT2022 ID642 TaxID=2942632 RepID=UPI00235EC19B|nr:methyltransferase domain-containing protein [Pseudomonas sp. TNT2022 ID642]MDD1005322.1 methyltransferase domain-containing protein [Pseudomonas sp. TNT2022 ID642]
MNVDLGCGKRKQEGFFGIDRFPMPEVDMLADIDLGIPLQDDSVDMLFSSHFLEHARDLMFTMREIYRVCKHGAQVCIIAPYNEQKLNIANPYHITIFNEHTPRFWTDHTETPVDEADYADPVKRPWGLSKSDNSNPGLDIRLINMEFFYFPEYLPLPLEQKRKFRNERFNVCDQIMYQLIVWKGDECSPGVSYEDHVSAFKPYEPHYIRHLKMHEQNEIIQKFTQSETALRQRIEGLKTELAQVTSAAQAASAQAAATPAITTDALLERRINELTEDRALTDRLLHEARADNHQLRLQVMSAFEKAEALSAQIHEGKTRLMKSQLEQEQLNDQIARLSEQNAKLESDNVDALLLVNELHERLAEAQSNTSAAHQSLLDQTQENKDLRSRLEVSAIANAKVALVKAELVAANGIIDWYRAKEETWNIEQHRLQQDVLNAQQATKKTALTQSPLAQQVQHLNLALNNAQSQASQSRNEALQVIDNLQLEVQAYRSSRSLQLVSLYKSKSSLWNSISPAFTPLRAFTEKHLLKTSRPVLTLGDDLRNVPYREYLMPLRQENLGGVLLAVRPLMRGQMGLLGVEIVSSKDEVVAHIVLPLADIDPEVPTRFKLPTVITLDANWYLRVFVRDSDVPVALYEVSQYSIMKKRTKYFPFAALQ